MTILVIDARSRGLDTFFATASKDARGDLVLRYASVGFIPQQEYAELVEVPFPILVTGGYQARSSAGHAMAVGYGGREVTVVGGLGKPFGRGGLRRLRRPIAGRLMPARCRVHRWDGNSSSNPGTAGAAIEAVRFMAEMDRNSVWIQEGQSDVVSFLRLEPSKGSVYPEFADEFQQGVYDPAIAPVRNALFGLLPEREENYDADGNRVEPTHEGREERKRLFMAAVYAAHFAWYGAGATCLPQLVTTHEEVGDDGFGRALDFLWGECHLPGNEGLNLVVVDRKEVCVLWTYNNYRDYADGREVTEKILTVPVDEEVATKIVAALQAGPALSATEWEAVKGAIAQREPGVSDAMTRWAEMSQPERDEILDALGLTPAAA